MATLRGKRYLGMILRCIGSRNPITTDFPGIDGLDREGAC